MELEKKYNHQFAPVIPSNNYEYVVLFPEGGLLNPTALKRSQEFERANGFHELNHLLAPRSAALTTILETFRGKLFHGD